MNIEITFNNLDLIFDCFAKNQALIGKGNFKFFFRKNCFTLFAHETQTNSIGFQKDIDESDQIIEMKEKILNQISSFGVSNNINNKELSNMELDMPNLDIYNFSSFDYQQELNFNRRDIIINLSLNYSSTNTLYSIEEMKSFNTTAIYFETMKMNLSFNDILLLLDTVTKQTTPFKKPDLSINVSRSEEKNISNSNVSFRSITEDNKSSKNLSSDGDIPNVDNNENEKRDDDEEEEEILNECSQKIEIENLEIVPKNKIKNSLLIYIFSQKSFLLFILI